MRLTLGQAAAVVALVGVSFGGGIWWTRRDTGVAAAQRSQAAFACPMHPQYRSAHPGDCGMCGMRLEPVKASEAAPPADASPALPPGAVHVSAERQQAVGVRLGTAERVSGSRMLRTTGRVVPNENTTHPIVAGVSGWIREVRGATTGSQVRRNEVLATIYSPELVTVQQSYYAGLETVDRAADLQVQTYNDQRIVEGVQRFADTLRNMGISDLQLAEMRRRRELAEAIYVVSPVDGLVLQRGASPGLRFDRGFEFYRVADLSHVWILADVYEHQMPFIRRGARARAVASQDGGVFEAVVADTEPIFDEATLTMKVRLEAPNPRLTLKPGMFVDVEIPIELSETLAVPADAIVDSGLRKTVFVERGEGYFEPRQVETGWRIGEQVEVLKGVMPGERIVISGTFLIDSESRMKAAAQGVFGATAEDPVCGMQVDQKRAAAAGRTVLHQGETFYFCADSCQRDFTGDPGRYLKHSTPHAPGGAGRRSAGRQGTMGDGRQPRPAAPATVTDPVCGMEIDATQAEAAGRKSEHQGRTYYFCADQCKKRFDAEPGTFTGEQRTRSGPDEHRGPAAPDSSRDVLR